MKCKGFIYTVQSSLWQLFVTVYFFQNVNERKRIIFDDFFRKEIYDEMMGNLCAKSNGLFPFVGPIYKFLTEVVKERTKRRIFLCERKI